MKLIDAIPIINNGIKFRMVKNKFIVIWKFHGLLYASSIDAQNREGFIPDFQIDLNKHLLDEDYSNIEYEQLDED